MVRFVLMQNVRSVQHCNADDSSQKETLQLKIQSLRGKFATCASHNTRILTHQYDMRWGWSKVLSWPASKYRASIRSGISIFEIDALIRQQAYPKVASSVRTMCRAPAKVNSLLSLAVRLRSAHTSDTLTAADELDVASSLG